MVKNELIRTIGEKVGVAQKDVDAVLTAFAEVVTETLASDKDEKIVLPSLGTFKVKAVPERRGISTLGEKKEWVKPAHEEITFKISKNVKCL